MVGGVFYEHGHRMIATTVGFLSIVLAFGLWRKEPRAWVRRLGWIGLATVILQGLLGGITVLYKLPMPVVIFHACLAQLFFCITLSLVEFTGRSWNQPEMLAEDSGTPQFRNLCAATSAAIVAQLALGAALRHKALDVIPHALGAILICLMVGWTIVRAMRLPELKPLQRLAAAMGILVIVQVALGGVSYLTRLTQEGSTNLDPIMIWSTTAHVATGAAVLGTSWVLTLVAFRRLAAPQPVPAFERNPEKSPA